MPIHITQEELQKLLNDEVFQARVKAQQDIENRDVDEKEYCDDGPSDEELLFEFLASGRKSRGPD